MAGFNFTDHSADVLRSLEDKTDAALEAIGLAAEGYAKANIQARPKNPNSWYTRTGRLWNSITHTVQKDTAYIGTNVTYAPYVEYGTGIYAEGETSDGKEIHGRQDVPWFYKDENGVGHITSGIKPSHFLKNAVTEHKDQYIKIAENTLKGR